MKSHILFHGKKLKNKGHVKERRLSLVVLQCRAKRLLTKGAMAVVAAVLPPVCAAAAVPGAVIQNYPAADRFTSGGATSDGI